MRGECATNLVGTRATFPHGLEETEAKEGCNYVPLVLLNALEERANLVFELVATQAQDHKFDNDSNGKKRDESLDAHLLMPKQ
jgi:hypothetical protein